MSVIAPGNVAVITGGASGIGLALAERFIAEDMRVVLADIDAPKLRDVEARLTEAGADVATTICIPASEIADAVVDAVVEERFWILTHPEMSHAPVERMERAEAQINPPMFGAA